MGQDISDAELLARLVALVSPALTAPLGTPQQIAVIDRLIQLSHRDGSEARARSPEYPGRTSASPLGT
jgi:hypothetical protein